MLDFIYQTGWGAFSVMLAFQLPFMLFFFYVMIRKSAKDSGSGDAADGKISFWKNAWMGAVVILFLAVNIASIQFMPAVSSARAVASGVPIEDVDVTAQSWSYEISKQEFVAGTAVRFNAKAADTVHGFAVYHPNGKILFTMMLVPGVQNSSLIYTFKDPGTYKVRCLEYCGIAHHGMNDEIIVTERKSAKKS